MCALLLFAPDASALQGLCDHSPENPTAVLGLLSAAAAGYPYARSRLRALLKRKGSAPVLGD